MCMSGLGLVLAWYSILDLREQRGERYWPHTVDRLLRVTFTVVSLVLVVNIAASPEQQQPREEPQDKPLPVADTQVETYFLFRDLKKLAQSPGTWNVASVQETLDDHFEEIQAKGGLVLWLDTKQSVTLKDVNGHLTAASVQ